MTSKDGREKLCKSLWPTTATMISFRTYKLTSTKDKNVPDSISDFYASAGYAAA